MHNIMLDLETLDTAATAVVLSIGAVAFDPSSNELGEKFYVELSDDLVTQERLGRTISSGTVRWWLSQGALAKTVLSEHAQPGVIRVPVAEGLSRFGQFVGTNGGADALIWGNGSDFDNLVLGSLYDSMGLKRPWAYRQNRCYRTMKNHPAVRDISVKNDGIEHNALDDAVAQAKHLQEIMKCLKSP